MDKYLHKTKKQVIVIEMVLQGPLSNTCDELCIFFGYLLYCGWRLADLLKYFMKILDFRRKPCICRCRCFFQTIVERFICLFIYLFIYLFISVNEQALINFERSLFFLFKVSKKLFRFTYKSILRAGTGFISCTFSKHKSLARYLSTFETLS